MRKILEFMPIIIIALIISAFLGLAFKKYDESTLYEAYYDSLESSKNSSELFLKMVDSGSSFFSLKSVNSMGVHYYNYNWTISIISFIMIFTLGVLYKKTILGNVIDDMLLRLKRK